MTHDPGISKHGAAPRAHHGETPAPQALRQWRDALLRWLERPAANASIDDRHSLLLELARCALDLREAGPGAPAQALRSRPFPRGG